MFLISLCLVLISSYLFTSLIDKNCRNKSLGFIYFLLICYAQIVLTSEILSLYTLIKPIPYLACNIFFLACSLVLWFRCGKPLYKPQLKYETARIKNSFKLDKILKYAFWCFIVFLISYFIIAAIFPPIWGDALGYYFPRVTSWIQNGNINHFITNDSRELIMPVNMEFLYMWNMLFLRTEVGTPVYSYISLIGLIYVVYNFLAELGFCCRKRLWTIFAFCSFAIIGMMGHKPIADLFIGALILASIFLFYLYCKKNEKSALYFSTLSYVLAIGTKTTAIIALPSVAIIFAVILYKLGKSEFKPIFFKYCGLFILNFIIFSSYNYILNFIQFGNPVSCSEQFLLNKFRGGIMGYITNLIKYWFVILFDAVGIEHIDKYNHLIQGTEEKILRMLGDNWQTYTSGFFENVYIFSSDMDYTTNAWTGILGLFLFVPALIISFIKGITKKYKTNYLILGTLGASFIFNVFLFSRVMVYTRYNYRYLVTFLVIALPILVLTYIKSCKNLYKWVIFAFMFTYMFLISHVKPVSFIINFSKYLLEQDTISLRYIDFTDDGMDGFKIYQYLYPKDKNNKIAFISYKRKGNPYRIEKLKLKGFHIDKFLLENIEDYNLFQYDYIIADTEKSPSSLVLKKTIEQRKQKGVAECYYLDYKMEKIGENEDKTPVNAVCEPPVDYIKQLGFEPVNDLFLTEYYVLKRKN